MFLFLVVTRSWITFKRKARQSRLHCGREEPARSSSPPACRRSGGSPPRSPWARQRSRQGIQRRGSERRGIQRIQRSPGEDRSRSSSLGLLVSGPIASGLTLSQAGNGEPEDVGAASLLHRVGVILHRNLHLLDDGLHDVWGVGEGGAQGIGVTQILS